MNGSLPEKDDGGGHDARGVRERFLILGRGANPVTDRMAGILGRLGRTEVIADSPGGGAVWYPDEEMEGFGGLMSDSGNFPRITAWSRAMYHLEATLEDGEAVWFVEDDVAGDAEAFAELVGRTAAAGADFAAFDIRSKHSDRSWPHWRHADGFFKEPWRCFKPLSRKSAGLVRRALDFRREHGRFTFHEVLFPSLAARNGMKTLDWNGDEAFRDLFPAFRYRPVLSQPHRGICHPVKDLVIHEAICRAGGDAVRGWRGLVIGAGDGSDVVSVLNERLECPGQVWAVDLYEAGKSGQRSDFRNRIKARRLEDRVHLFEGEAVEVLAWLIAGDGWWESFDRVQVGDCGGVAERLAAACQAWSLLKGGGTLTWSLDEPGSRAAEMFLEAFAGKYRRAGGAEMLALEKLEGPAPVPPWRARTVEKVRAGTRPQTKGKPSGEGLSAVILNWTRPENLHRILEGWHRGGVVTSAIVWNNRPEVEIRHPWAKVLNANADFGLYSRFAAAALAPTEAVLIQDDDLEIAAEDIERLYAHWRADPGVLHGIFGRAPKEDGSYARFIDGIEGDVPVVLTRALIGSRGSFARFFLAAPAFEEIQRGSVPRGNGEDIILSYSVRQFTGRLNRVHAVGVRELSQTGAIHRRVGWKVHALHRSRVMEAAEAWLAGA